METIDLDEEYTRKLKRIVTTEEIETVTVARELSDIFGVQHFGDIYKGIIKEKLKND